MNYTDDDNKFEQEPALESLESSAEGELRTVEAHKNQGGDYEIVDATTGEWQKVEIAAAPEDIEQGGTYEGLLPSGEKVKVTISLDKYEGEIYPGLMTTKTEATTEAAPTEEPDTAEAKAAPEAERNLRIDGNTISIDASLSRANPSSAENMSASFEEYGEKLDRETKTEFAKLRESLDQLRSVPPKIKESLAEAVGGLEGKYKTLRQNATSKQSLEEFCKQFMAGDADSGVGQHIKALLDPECSNENISRALVEAKSVKDLSGLFSAIDTYRPAYAFKELQTAASEPGSQSEVEKKLDHVAEELGVENPDEIGEMALAA